MLTNRRPFVLLIAALTALLASAAFVAGCGGDDPADEDVASVLEATFGADEPVKSGKLDVGLTLDAQGLQGIAGPIAVKLTGPFEGSGDGELPAFDFDLELDAAGQAFTAGAVSTGEKGFLELQGQSYAVGDELFAQFRDGYKKAQEEAEKEADGKSTTSFKALGIDPLRWLSNGRNAGTEEVGGTETIHVTGDIDVAKFLVDVNTVLGKAADLGVAGAQNADVPTSLTEEQRKQIAEAVKSAKVDIYSGAEDKLLRKLAVAIDFDVPEASREAAGGLQAGKLALELTIADLNEGQDISEPEDARPLEELTGALGGLAGGGAAAPNGAGAPNGAPAPEAGAGAGGGAAAPPAGPSANPEYLQCLEDAGTDLAKVQACAGALQR